MSYAELHCLSNFSFLRGASRPEELVARARTLGYAALAITDECSLAGVVKAHVTAKQCGLKLIIGSEFHIDETLTLILLAPDRRAYAELSGLITLARRRSPKGSYALQLSDFEFNVRHCLAIWTPSVSAERGLSPLLQSQGASLLGLLSGRLWLGVEMLLRAGEQDRYLSLYQLASDLDIPMLACGNVLMHDAERKPLADVLCAIRHNLPLAQLGTRLASNAEQHLRPLEQLVRIYPATLLEESLRIAARCHFSLDELRYEYPCELVPPARTPIQYLRELVMAGSRQRWPDGIATHVHELMEKELALIHELSYEYYFLTVHDIVQFARANAILCQGRGSAANSVVCYCLFITEVDPARISVLFERFISRERNEPPDIDVDFEHERREEVIQYIYKKYSRERAALAATVITYRPRSAVRDVGKALGLDPQFVDQLATSLSWWDGRADLVHRFEAARLASAGEISAHFLRLVDEILGFPRHLSQHVGGFIITAGPLSALVPVENAAMPERTVIQWDKDDIDALGLLKVDILALGMLSAIRRCFGLIRETHGQDLDLGRIPAEDPETYAMLQRADSIGVFQVESRAQMAMLPRLKPRTFYDLVIEVAIVRPGPIQGNMVHPYLKRRQGIEAVSYPNAEVREVLERTLGVPIFQEQVIKLAMVAAGFSGGEADQLRRAMAAWKRNGNLLAFEDKVIDGMLARGHSREFAERLFSQMKGFGDYGFPESHAASFALLAYASAWLKCHYPAAFCCALLNSQPMGFYTPSQLVQDIRRHDVVVLPVDVAHSVWESTLEKREQTPFSPAIRLGMHQIKGFGRHAAERILHARDQRPFTNLQDLARRATLGSGELDTLINAGALPRLTAHRHQAHWQADAIEPMRPLFAVVDDNPQALDDGVQLVAPSEAQNIVADYRSLGLTLGRHPMALLRDQPPFPGCQTAIALGTLPNGRFIRIAGLVTGRQRPGTASGVLFLTLEDETGNASIIVWKECQERCHRALLKAQLMIVKGVVESRDSVSHVIARELIDCSASLAALPLRPRNFR